MRRFLAALFNFIAKSIAAVFAALFVIVTVLVLCLVNVDYTLLNAETYKRVLMQQAIYEQAPALIADQLGTLEAFIANPCKDNPLACRIDGAPPELQACLTQTLGEDAYLAVGTGRRAATEAELQLAQPCLDQFAGWPGGENPLPSTSPEALACVKQAVGDRAYDTLITDQRPPTDAEAREIAPCLEQDADNPGDTGAGGGQMEFMKNLTRDDWERLIRTLLPQDLMQSMTEEALEQVFAYSNGETDSASMSLVLLKERLASQTGRDVIELLVTAQPPCTEEELVQMNARVSGGEGEMVLCNPPKDRYSTLVSDMQNELAGLVAEMPDEAVLIKPATDKVAGTDAGPFDQDPLTVLRYIRLGFRFSPLLPLGILLLVTVFGVRSLKGWLRWWGIPMLIAGLISFGIGIAALIGLDWVWVNHVAVRIPPYLSSGMSEIGRDLLNSVVRELSKSLMLESGALSLVGLAAILASYFVRVKPKEAAPLQEST